MTQQLIIRDAPPTPAIFEEAMVKGDLSGLTPEQRVMHYKSVCESLGLNPLTRPFQYITFQGQLTLYARKDATDQLAEKHKISRRIISRERTSDGLQIAVAECTTPDGRCEDAMGVVAVDGLRGEALANALMKADTKAKRRGTLGIVGLGWLDETEVETVPGARYVDVDDGGNITGSRPVIANQPRAQIAAPAMTQHSAITEMNGSARTVAEVRRQQPAASGAVPAISESQMKAIHARGAKALGADHDALHDACVAQYQVGLSGLTAPQASEFYGWLDTTNLAEFEAVCSVGRPDPEDDAREPEPSDIDPEPMLAGMAAAHVDPADVRKGGR